MQKYTLFLFLILSFSTLFAQEFDVKQFNALPNDVSARMNERLTVNEEPAALIRVTTNITEMQFDSPFVLDTEKNAEGYWVWIVPRTREIRVLASGYLPIDIALPEPARPLMVYQLIISSKDGGHDVTDMLRVTFRLNESNVFIQTGKTAPVEALTRTPFFNLPKGRHNFWFFKEGFQEQEIKLDELDDQIFDVEMLTGVSSTRSTLSEWIFIKSNPPGAYVFLNHQMVGTTPYKRLHVLGSYIIRLQSHLYQDHIDSFTLTDGDTLNLPLVNLVPQIDYWQVNSNPSGAEVYLDGKLAGATPLAKTPINIGMHEMTLRYPLYHEHKESFHVNGYDNHNFSIDLKPAYGELIINSEPSGARVSINNREVGTTPYINPRQPSGTYNVTVKKELYSDWRDQAIVHDGERTERVITLGQDFDVLQLAAQQQQVMKYRRAKRWYGLGTLAAASAGGYYLYSFNSLANIYPIATNNATDIYKQMVRHEVISYITFGTAVPLGILFLINAGQQNNTQRRINLAASPVEGGAIVGLIINMK